MWWIPRVNTDSDVIQASLAAPAKFEEVWHRHSATVFRYAASRLGPEAAEDVLSATFLIAFRKRARFDLVRTDAAPWLLGIATHEIHRHRRTEARTLDTLHRHMSGEEHESTPRLAEQLDAAAALRQAGATLRAMPERDRDVLLLYAWGELDYAAIADALRIPIGTVRSRLNRARRTLRTAHPHRPTNEGDTHGRLDPA